MPGDRLLTFWAKMPLPIIANPRLRGSPLAVYAYIDLRAGARGTWYGLQREIAAALGLSHATVQRAVRLLRGEGVISTTREGRSDGMLTYQVAFRMPPKQLPLAGMEYDEKVDRFPQIRGNLDAPDPSSVRGGSLTDEGSAEAAPLLSPRSTPRAIKRRASTRAQTGRQTGNEEPYRVAL